MIVIDNCIFRKDENHIINTLFLEYTHAMFTEIMNILCTIIATIINVATWSSLLFTASRCSSNAENCNCSNKLYHLPISRSFIHSNVAKIRKFYYFCIFVVLVNCTSNVDNGLQFWNHIIIYITSYTTQRIVKKIF